MARPPAKLDGLEDSTVVAKRESKQSEEGEELQAVVVGSSLLGIHPLPASGKITIGRYKGSGIAIEHETISRFHAVLNLGPPHTIEDQGSANGTTVEGVPISPGQKTRIELGTVIKVGSVVVVVQRRKT